MNTEHTSKNIFKYKYSKYNQKNSKFCSESGEMCNA